MIYLFHWERELVGREVDRWVFWFWQKYSQMNIIKIKTPSDYDINFYTQNFLWGSFFDEKKLIILYDFPVNIWEKDEKILKLQNSFLDLLQKKDENNIVVFYNTSIDKRSKIYKKIQEIGEIKDFSIKDENDIKNMINNLYNSQISSQALSKLIELKKQNFSLIKQEIDKLLISRDFIDLKDLSFVSLELDDNIFEIINLLLNKKITQSINKIRELNEVLDNFYLLFNSLSSNLRVYFYIFKLKELGYSQKEIVDILNLWKRAFIISRTWIIEDKTFFELYEKIINIDSQMKTWKLIWSDKEDLMFELEKRILYTVK